MSVDGIAVRIIMSCTCVDANGSLLDRCLGTCISANAYIQQQQVIRAYQENRIENIINKELKNIYEKLSEVKDFSEHEFLRGFEKGFIMAKDIYEYEK
jgi:hypothetical protein